MYSRIKQVRQSLAVVCYANSIDEITSDDYRVVDAVLEITSPFRGFTKKLQQEGVPTISLVYAGVKGLIERMSDAVRRNVLPEIARDLEQRLKAQFADVINSGNGEHDPIFLAAACLDPPAAQASNVFDENQLRAGSTIKEMAKTLIDPVENDEVVEELAPSTSESLFGFEVTKKKPRLVTSGSPSRPAVELEEYRAMFKRPITVSSAEFWRLHESKLCQLAVIARHVLAVPATSASVERLFSQMTLHSSGHKGRSKAKAIRRKSLPSFNESYIKI